MKLKKKFHKNKIFLQIAYFENYLYYNYVEKIFFYSYIGKMSVSFGHSPLLTYIKKNSYIKILKINKKYKKIFIINGFIEINTKKISILINN